MKKRAVRGACAVLLVLGGAVSAGAARSAGRAACAIANRRHLLLISARSGVVDCSFPDAKGGSVEASTSDGHGGWFVAGDFTRIGKRKVAGIAHVSASGRLDRAWQGRTPAGVGYPANGADAVVLRAGILYVAGRTWVEALSARTGARRWLVRTFNRNAGWTGLAVNGRHVFFDGNFTQIQGKQRNGLVALDPRTGAVQPWQAPGLRIGSLGGLGLDRGRLYVSGTRGVEGVDATTGKLTGWHAPQAYGAPVRLASHGYVFIYNFASRESSVLSERTGRTVTTFGPNNLSVMAVSGDTLYGWGGDASTPGPWVVHGHKRESLAAFNLTTGRLARWAPHIRARYIDVESISADAKQVLVGGAFTATLG